MKKWYWVLATLPLLMFACREDIDEITTTRTDPPLPEVRVTASLIGVVVDENETPLPGTVVRIGTAVTTTNEEGRYVFNDVAMNAKGTHVMATRTGFFPGSDRIYPTNNSRHTNVIKLLNRTLAGTVDVNGGEISVEGALVSFPNNAFAYPSGLLYDGSVNVYATWLDPTADDLGEFMPGGLFGLTEEGGFTTMASFGMLMVELEDNEGNELELALSKKATLHFPVPAELQAGATAEIPLWFFDEQDGIWIEEGSATLDGTTYVGEVSHFTSWNVDFPFGTSTVDISGCLEYADGAPAINTNFTITTGPASNDTIYTAVFGRTDAEGNFAGPIPAGENLTLNTYDECGNVESVPLGIITTDTEFTECFVITNTFSFVISGQLVDCDGNGIAGGIISLQHDWYAPDILTDDNGAFSYVLPACATSTEVTILGIDYENLVTSESQTIIVTGDTDPITLVACDNPLAEFIIHESDGVETVFVTPYLINLDTIGAGGGQSFYLADNQETDTNSQGIDITLPDIAVGSYSGEGAAFTFNAADFSGPATVSTILRCGDPCADITINITANGGPGGFLEGNYTGQLDGFDEMQLPLTDVPVNGTFRVMIPQ